MSRTRVDRRLGWSLTIYCTREENVLIRDMAARSTSRSFSEYARKVLTGKPVALTYRNVSLDALIEALNALRQQLDQLMSGSSGPAENELERTILQDIKIIADKINQQCIPV